LVTKGKKIKAPEAEVDQKDPLLLYEVLHQFCVSIFIKIRFKFTTNRGVKCLYLNKWLVYSAKRDDRLTVLAN